MPVCRIPDDPNLEQFNFQAQTLHDFVRAGVPQALEMVHEFHPGHSDLGAGSAEAEHFTLADAELVVARRHDFASWAELRAHMEVVARYGRAPHRSPVGAPVTTEAELVDEFLRLACLTHGDDDPSRWRRAEELLAEQPGLTGTSLHAAAAAGDVAATRRLLERDASAVSREGGPYRWEPLLYLAYSAIDEQSAAPLGALPGSRGRSHLEVARLLLDAGADPNAGYLWEGLPSPYTALTGALTSAHSEPLALGRLLLERGADANDSQLLYELGLDASDDTEALELLYEFGLGTGRGGVWHSRLAQTHPTPAALVSDELIKAAAANRPRQARLVLDHGVDLDGLGIRHPIFEGLTAYELAVVNGNTEVAEILEVAGADADGLDPELRVLGACMRADRAEVERLRAGDPTIVERAIARRPVQISDAADQDRFEALKLMVELGFDVDAHDRPPHRQTALHGAAYNGNLEMVRFLVEHGADRTIEDCSFRSPPLGWAEHNQQTHVVDYLRQQDQAAGSQEVAGG